MTVLRHGGLVFDVPDGWSDQSTLVFVAPPSSTEAAPVETLSVRFAAVRGEDAACLARAEIQALSRLENDVATLSEGTFHCGLGEGARIEIRVDLGGFAMRQIVCAVVAGPIAVIASATGADAHFDRVRAALERSLSSLRPAPAA